MGIKAGRLQRIIVVTVHQALLTSAVSEIGHWIHTFKRMGIKAGMLQRIIVMHMLNLK